MKDQVVEQNKAIKARLYQRFQQEEDQEYKRLAERINKALKLKDPVSDRNLSSILTPSAVESDSTPKLYTVLALCRYWGLSYDKVFAPPGADTNSIPEMGQIFREAKILDDKNFMGTLYGYFHTRNLKHASDIFSFELELKEEERTAVAVMTVKGKDGAGRPAQYVGTPLLLKSEDMLFLPLYAVQPEDGPDHQKKRHSYFLYMEYVGHNEGIRYRKGIAITRSKEYSGINSNQMILQNFVLFRNPLDKEDVENYVRGMLPVISDSFVISEEAAAELAQDEEMREFFDKYQYNWERNTVSGHLVKISQVTASLGECPTEAEKLRVISALLRMIAKSVEPVFLSYTEPFGMEEFSKAIQQK